MRRHYSTLAVVLILLLAGCASGGPVPAAPEPSDTPNDSEEPRGPATGSEWTVTITRVVDGDTVEARFPNGTVDTIRLLGVDTPETTYGDVSPDEYEGFPTTTAARDHLFNWGEKASHHATDTLAGEDVRLVLDSEADRRGYFGRLLGYIYVDGENYNKQLLADGYARYYDSTFSQAESFAAAEQTARSEQRGLWAFGGAVAVDTDSDADSGDDTDTHPSGTETVLTSQLSVAGITPDAPGNDNENPNGEYVTFGNIGDDALDISGWTISDAASHTYTVPEGVTLSPGEQITLYSGQGTDTDDALYWGSGTAIWNNGGDTVIVENATGSVVLKYPY